MQENVDGQARPVRAKRFLQFSVRTLLVLMLLVAVYLGGRYSFRSGTHSGAIAGTWEMTLPAGFKHQIEFVPMGNDRFLLRHASINSAGIYQVGSDGKLAMVAPADPALLGFVWQVQPDGTMLLVGQPPSSKTGSNYLGTILTRLD